MLFRSDSMTVAQVLAFVLIWLAVPLLFSLVASLLTRAMEAVSLGWLNNHIAFIQIFRKFPGIAIHQSVNLIVVHITVLCLIIGALSYSKLPVKIPVQWSKGVATSLVNKNWIFICPVICIIIRYLLKPFIYVKLQMNNYYGDIITEYLTNYMCFIVLSVEIFSILFTFGVVKSVVVLLFVNTAVFMGLLVVGLTKMDLRGKEIL